MARRVMAAVPGDRVRAMVLANGAHAAASAGEGAKRQARIEAANVDMAGYAAGWVPTVLASASLALTRPEAGAHVGGFGFPVLLITGDQDHLSPQADQAAFAALFARAEVRAIAGAGHLTPFEQPAAVVAVVSGWLEGVAG